jgi:phosphoserine aminotransferase
MSRVANFGAGPGVLPESVLNEASHALLNIGNCGAGILEVSHRAQVYDQVHNSAIDRIKNLLNVPDTHLVLFTQGGASLQFSAVPLNFGGRGNRALYLVSGQWSAKAAKEAEKYLGVQVIKSPVPDSKDDPPYAKLPIDQNWELNEADAKDLAYVYYCDNETVDGSEFQFVPKVPDSVPLVSDMSSNFLSRPVDVAKFGMIYAGAQKNLAPAGLVIIIGKFFF